MTKSPIIARHWFGPRFKNPVSKLAPIAAAAMAGVLFLSHSMVMAQQTGAARTGPNFYYVGGKAYPLKPSSRWAGVQLQPGTSATRLTARLGTRNGVDPDRTALTYKHQNIVLMPLDTQSGVGVRNTLTTQLKQEAGVRNSVRVFENGGYQYPIVETDEFLIQFKPGVSQQQAAALLAPYTASLVEPLGPYAPNGYLARVNNVNRTSTEVANALHSKPQVLFSHPNYIWPMQPRFVPNDPLYPQQWHLNNTGQGSGTPGADVKAQQAWDVTTGSSNIIIAVIDSGIDVDHEDFVGKMVPGFDAIDNDGDPRPTFGTFEAHGTAVAGIAAATGNNGIGVTGMAMNCKIMPIRLITFGSTIQDQADAFRFATDNGADVINNSWGPADFTGQSTPLPDVVRRAIDYAVTRGRGGRGSVVLFAAGNGNPIDSADQDGYASYEKVISVVATTNLDTQASYSETGTSVDVAAPSSGGTLGTTTTDIMGAIGYDGSNYTSTFGGTSSACPLTSGVAALILSVNPGLNYTQVRDILQNTAEKIDPVNANYDLAGHSNIYGYGRINAFSAVKAASVPIPTVTLLAPIDNEVIGGNYLLRAVTSNNANEATVRRVDFYRRGEGSEASITRTPSLSVPDGGTATDAQALTASGTVEQATITIDITHSNPFDLVVTLIAPDNSRTVVYNGDPRAIIVSPTGLGILVNQPVPVQGKKIAGTWRLEVADTFANGLSGILNSWSLDFSAPWVPIGSATAQVNGEWRAIWSTGSNTSTPPGLYAVRAVAVTTTANAEAISRNVTVTPLGVTLFAPAEGETVNGKYVMRARTTDDAAVQRVDFQRRKPAFSTSRQVDKTLIDGETVSDSIVVSGRTGRVGEAKVTVSIRHTYVGDLRISLVAPDNSRTVILDNQGGAQRDLNTTFFNVPVAGKPLNGTWTLEVSDGQAIDEGTFVSWTLTLASEWILINRDSDGATSGEWNAEWNADVTEPGVYDVRAVAVSANGNAFDVNTNVTVQSRTFDITGRVTSSTGTGLSDIPVTLTSINNTTGPITVRTDATGQYTLTGVVPGVYTVSPAQTGNSFLPGSRTVTVSSGSTSGINFIQRAPDRIVPDLTVTTPTANSGYSNLTAATGTASDDPGGSGLAQVTGVLFRFANGATPAGYWNGTTFTTTLSAANERPATGVTATGTSNWRIAFPSLAAGKYYFRATATDRAGNVKRSSNLVFTVDRSTPTIRVTRPAPAPNNTYLASELTSAAGTASDNAGGVGLEKVTVLLFRYANGSLGAGYWNGSAWRSNYDAATQELLATGTTNWTKSLPGLAPGRYWIRATATDKAGNVQRSATANFTIIAPTAATVRLSSIALSTGSATARTGLVQLRFGGALDAVTASDPTHYTISVNGVRVSVESASYAASSHVVTLALSEGALSAGSTVEVAWSGLTDARGQQLAAGKTKLVAR